MRRRTVISLIAVGAIAVTVLLAGCVDEKNTLNLGYQPSTHQLAAMVAAEKGWWEEDLAKFGIDEVELFCSRRGRQR